MHQKKFPFSDKSLSLRKHWKLCEELAVKSELVDKHWIYKNYRKLKDAKLDTVRRVTASPTKFKEFVQLLLDGEKVNKVIDEELAKDRDAAAQATASRYETITVQPIETDPVGQLRIAKWFVKKVGGVQQAAKALSIYADLYGET
jgi:hypothetical protein